jgi:uncharacterized Zn finger protein
MPRETVAAKARRYLAEGRVTILRVGDAVVRAEVRGDGEIYETGYSPSRGWICSCPVRGPRCCHVLALRLVVVRPESRRERAA